MEKVYCVYILTNARNTVLYTGVASGLRVRIAQHREKLLPGFTRRYNVTKLKAGSRRKKLDLINSLNPEWRDLYENL